MDSTKKQQKTIHFKGQESHSSELKQRVKMFNGLKNKAPEQSRLWQEICWNASSECCVPV